jgi:hypothetical protein
MRPALAPLAALISGIMARKRTQLPTMAANVPDGTKAESRVKRFARGVGNDHLTAERYVVPYAAVVLAHLAFQTLGLVIDGRVVGRRRGALMIHAIPTPWLHQDTTTIVLYGASEDEPQTPGAPRPAYGHSKDGCDDLKQVLLSLGVSGDGGVPLRLGMRDGN